jgi:diguanylate cyclase (GGDEF)-like protein
VTTSGDGRGAGGRRNKARRRGHARVSSALVEHLPIGIVVLGAGGRGDPSFRVTDANRTASEMSGLSHDELLGMHASALLGIAPDPGDPDGADAPGLEDALREVLRSGEPLSLDNVTLLTPGCAGRTYALRVFRVARQTLGASIEDITDQVAAAAALHHRALHDALTGLPNRVLLGDRLRHSLRETRRSGEPVALLLLDLDQFKEVNDQLGHHHGDTLLVAVAARLRELLRDCDTFARLGGDEFALLLTDARSLDGARAVATKIAEALERPFPVGTMSISVRASIGIAMSPEHGEDDETLMRRADMAMYKAKRRGGGIAVYDAESERSNAQRLSLAGDLERAIARGELRLAYQPILDITTRRVERVEALVRWQHPNLGLLPPKEFVDLAALSGVIGPLTTWVIDRAVHQVAEWRERGIDLAVSVNLAARNLFELEVPAVVGARLADLALPGSALTVEISEGDLVDDPRAALDVLAQIRAFGVRTSVDDFGTGASSIGMLHELPIDEIKIDCSFVAKLDGTDAGAALVRSMADLGRNLGIDVVAEGVQTAAALALVTELGCGYAQGYHIGPPMSAGAVGLVAAATQERDPVVDIRD